MFGMKLSKELITAFLCANRSRKLLVMGKIQKLRCFKNAGTFTLYN